MMTTHDVCVALRAIRADGQDQSPEPVVRPRERGSAADVLLICDDPDSTDLLLAVASASEIGVDVQPEVSSAALLWSRAAVVVVGADLLSAVVGVRLPRRPGVVVFGRIDAQDWRLAFELGAEAVVDPPGDQGWLSDLVARAGQSEALGAVVGVLGCRGGAGASVFASSLAMAAVRARRTPYLFDLDPLGCGLAVILGADRASGLTWDQVRAGLGRIPARSLEATIGHVEGIGLLGWSDDGHEDLPAGVASAVIDAARLCVPLTVVDLGRGAGASQQEALARCDRVLMVVPADVRSVRAARRMSTRFELSMCEIVVRGPNPGGLASADVGEAVGLPVLAAVAADRGLDQRLERGEPPGYRSRTPLARASAGILREVLG